MLRLSTTKLLFKKSVPGIVLNLMSGNMVVNAPEVAIATGPEKMVRADSSLSQVIFFLGNNFRVENLQFIA